MKRNSKPHSLTLRAYQVGFGDCFLLTFHYETENRHVLIDFGSTGAPRSASDRLLIRVAEDIRDQCNRKLHAIVATHRHQDHINGFATRNGKGPGDIIARCRPDVVVQPWTEHPRAPRNSKGPVGRSGMREFMLSLRQMQDASESVLRTISASKSGLRHTLSRELSFLGEDNIRNRPAVENLLRMGKRHSYVYAGSKSGLETVLPGVKIFVLGPPTLKQSETIGRQRARDAAEFWHLQGSTLRLMADRVNKPGKRGILFPKAKTLPVPPPQMKLWIENLIHIHGTDLLGIVRTLDTVLNNTSIILLFEVGGKKFLFPGDAQIENWSYALRIPKFRQLLSTVNVYKVGHHGSRNATPKSLWDLFRYRSTKASPERLTTILSTMSGKHGNIVNGTEVPRRKLVDALSAESSHFTTQHLRGKTLRRDFTFRL